LISGWNNKNYKNITYLHRVAVARVTRLSWFDFSGLAVVLLELWQANNLRQNRNRNRHRKRSPERWCNRRTKRGWTSRPRPCTEGLTLRLHNAQHMAVESLSAVFTLGRYQNVQANI